MVPGLMWGLLEALRPGEALTTPLLPMGRFCPRRPLSLSNVGETYEEVNPSVVNPNAVASNNFAEWDWVLEENGAPFNTTFFFRMVKGDD